MVRQVFEVAPLVLVAVAAPVATGLAALSYEVFERPIRRAKVLDRFPWTVVATGLGTSVLVAVLVLPPLLHSTARPAVGAPDTGDLSAVAAQAAWADDPVPAGLDLPAALADVPDAGSRCTPDDLERCVRVTGDGARVLLVGDSQAAMFVTAFESLAREHDLTLMTNIVRGCGWQAGLVPECSSELETFYTEVLPALDVDVVVAVSLSRGEPAWQERLADPARPAGETLSQLHVRVAAETADDIEKAGARLVMVKALLGTNGYQRNGADPLDCLARASRLGDCAVIAPLEKPFTDGILDALAAATPDRAAAVDLNPVLCPDAPICRPVIDGTVVWKDPDHVTGTFLDEQREDLWARLTETGFLG